MDFRRITSLALVSFALHTPVSMYAQSGASTSSKSASTASSQTKAVDAAQIFSRAVRTYQSAKTMRVEFQQTLTNSLIGSKSTSKGELLRQQPNLFSINFSDPESDRIVCDGSNIWLYLPSTAPKQVIKVRVKAGNTMLVDPLGQLLGASDDAYAIKAAGKATIGGRATTAITLTPKAAPTLFTSATIWVDDSDGVVRQVETNEQSGLKRNVVITKYTTGMTIAKSAFQFKPAAKVRVIDQQSMMKQ